MSSREALHQAKSEGNQAAVLGIAMALIDAGDEGDPTGSHRFDAGMALFGQAHYLEAGKMLEAAADLLPLGSLTRARALANSGIAHLRFGTIVSAERVAMRVLAECTGESSTDFCRQVGAAHHTFGCVAELQRRYDVAAQHFHLAAGIYPDPWRKLTAQADQAWVLALQAHQRPEETAALATAQMLLDGLDESVLVTYPPGQFIRLATLALVRHVAGDHLGAVRAGDDAMAMDVAGKDGKRAELLVWLCHAARAAGDMTKARQYLHRARGYWNSTHSFIWDAIIELEGAIGIA